MTLFFKSIFKNRALVYIPCNVNQTVRYLCSMDIHSFKPYISLIDVILCKLTIQILMKKPG